MVQKALLNGKKPQPLECQSRCLVQCLKWNQASVHHTQRMQRVPLPILDGVLEELAIRIEGAGNLRCWAALEQRVMVTSHLHFPDPKKTKA